MPKFQKILHPEKFNLILYYALTSFIVIAIISLAVGWIFPRMEGQALIKRSEEYAHYFISHLNYKIYKDFLLPIIGKDKQIDLENNHRQFKKLDTVVRENIYGLKDKETVFIRPGRPYHLQHGTRTCRIYFGSWHE